MGDFQWLNAEYSQAINYQVQHFSQCSQYPEICPPISDSCATGLCNNCPRYYDTCCLQSTAAYTDCFSSLANRGAPPITMTMGSGGNAGGSAAATSGGAAMATSMMGNSGSSGDAASMMMSPATTPAPTSMPAGSSSSAAGQSAGSSGSSGSGGSSTQSAAKAGGAGRGGVKARLMVGLCVLAIVFVR